jgi:glycosyltransferase involved in cell wall biosynthesis
MITVLVTAFNRKQFLPEALCSVINQTLDPSEYEVIVVKNFADSLSDRIIRERGFKEIFCSDPRQGIHYMLALREASGEVICPLDDDDLFHPNKLEYIRGFYAQNRCLGFVRNTILAFRGDVPQVSASVLDAGFRDLLVRRIRSSGKPKTVPYPFNSSAMAIKRDILLNKIDLLSKVETSVDPYMFYAACMADCDVLFTSKILTYYRIHGSNNSQQFDTNQQMFLDRRLRTYKHWAHDWGVIRELCRGSAWEYEATEAMYQAELGASLLGTRDRKRTAGSLYRYTLCEFSGIWKDKTWALHHARQLVDPSSWVYRGALGVVSPRALRRLLFLRVLNNARWSTHVR